MKHQRFASLTGPPVTKLMHQHKVTISALAKKLQVTQVRVREVRAKGVKGQIDTCSWLEAITGTYPAETITVGIEEHPVIGQHHRGFEPQKTASFLKTFVTVNKEFKQNPTFIVSGLERTLTWHNACRYGFRPTLFGINPGQLIPGDRITIDLAAWLGTGGKSRYAGLSTKWVNAHVVMGRPGVWGSGHLLMGGPEPEKKPLDYREMDAGKLPDLAKWVGMAAGKPQRTPSALTTFSGQPAGEKTQNIALLAIGKEFLDWDAVQFLYRNAAGPLTFARIRVTKKLIAFVVFEGKVPIAIATQFIAEKWALDAKQVGRAPFTAPKGQKKSAFRSILAATKQKQPKQPKQKKAA